MEDIETIERLASLNLALTRNRLLLWDVGSGMVAVVVGMAALITGTLFKIHKKNCIH
jgi:putative exporter of polyketide antibiotics